MPLLVLAPDQVARTFWRDERDIEIVDGKSIEGQLPGRVASSGRLFLSN